MSIEVQYQEVILGNVGSLCIQTAENYIYARLRDTGFSLITLEGPPPYLDPAQPVHRWDNRAFLNGWRLLSALRNRLEQEWVQPVQHWVMIDDVHVNQNFDVESAAEKLMQLRIIPPAEVTIKEQQFMLDTGDECTTMDSRFQFMKYQEGLRAIWEYVCARNMNLDQINLPLNIVIHPISFQGQQAGMLSELLRTMKSDPGFLEIPKKRRMDLLEKTYLHLWLDDNTGEIVDLSVPRMNGGGFVHRSLIFQGF